MAGRLLASNIQIDQFVASPAKRARKTALLFMDVFQQKKKDLLLVPDLYMASPSTFAQVIAGFDDRYNSVALFSHNPGITDFANTLTEVRLDNMPTCSVFAVSVAADHWTDFATAAKSFVFFDFPKSAKGQV